MVTRRSVLTALTASPVLAALRAIPRVESAVLPSDVVVIEAPGLMTMEVAERIKAHVQQTIPGVPVIVLSDGLKLSVHRGIAKVELPEGV